MVQGMCKGCFSSAREQNTQAVPTTNLAPWQTLIRFDLRQIGPGVRDASVEAPVFFVPHAIIMLSESIGVSQECQERLYSLTVCAK